MKYNLLPLALLALLPGPALAQAMTPADYVAAAGASDLYEQQSATLILQSTQDPKIRAFAQMMLVDHSKSTALVKTAAKKARIAAPPPALTPLQTELIAELGAETRTARDAAYVAQQKAAHGQALALQKAFAAGGQASPLKAAAATIVPVVEHHIAMLKTM